MNLSLPIEKLRNVGSRNAPRLHRLGIKTLKDLLWHLPARYDDYSETVPISDIAPDQKVNIQGEVIKITTKKLLPRLRQGFGGQARGMFITNAIVKDLTGAVKAVWFNQPFIENHLPEGSFVSLAGKVKTGKNGTYLSSPTYEKITSSQVPSSKFQVPSYELKHTHGLVPVYPETEGVTSKYLRFLIQPLLCGLQLNDPTPDAILKKHNFPSLTEAIKNIHFPDSEEEARTARERLAFDDLMLFQIKALLERRKLNQLKSVPIPFNGELIKNFISGLPFELTKDQKIALFEILKDLEKKYPMNRLMEGDVGSGKTVVALIAAYQIAKAGYQTVFLVPTEVLAQQHYQTISALLRNPKNPNTSELSENDKTGVGLLTSSMALLNDREIKKTELKNKIADGDVSIIIGTHAIIQRDVEFKNLATVVIDEQHRFGINQRKALVRGSTQIDTRINADGKLLYEDLTYKIRGSIFSVYNSLGSGHREIIYHKALLEEFKNRGLCFETEKTISLNHRDKQIGTYKTDIVVDNSVILELKALPFVGDTEKKQLWSYLKGSSYKVAFLVNFGPELTIKRVVYDSARNLNPRSSAFIPRESAQEVRIPHLLSMTATPIPRTLALTIYGDLDISIIREKPKNRQKINTKIISPTQRKTAYQFLRREVEKGRQVFVVCPRIELSEATGGKLKSIIQNGKSLQPKAYNSKLSSLWADVKAVEEEYKKLSQEIFPDLKVAMLHGKMKPKEKNKIMNEFKDGRHDILISTSVIEVGVDVPNATIMAIESAERFGLAQLHQFRGRVGRGEHQSHCLLFSSSGDKSVNQRLKALAICDDGFELAEKDMAIRGPGEFMGTKQSGIPDLAMASLANIDLIKKARTEARLLLKEDPSLKKYPLLLGRLNDFQRFTHFE